MDAAERLATKKRIISTLGSQPWSDIDLTLGEFGFSTTDDWRGDATSYVIEMLRGSTDDAIIELDRYFHPKASESAVAADDPFDDPSSPWKGLGFRLFISHVTPYAEHAEALRDALAKRSVDGFVAHTSIAPTEDWKKTILTALESCDACLALLTPGFRESDWTDQETGFCMARRVLVIPAAFGQIPYGFLNKYQALLIKPGQDPASIAVSISELLTAKPQSRDAMARALVERWKATGSWDAARENYNFLRRIPSDAWTPELTGEVWEASERNSELREASIDWKTCDRAVADLFEGLSFEHRPKR